MAKDKETSTKQFSFETVAALVAAFDESVGAKHYKLMSKVDGTKTESSFEHAFREVKKRAKVIGEKAQKGDYGDLTAAAASTPKKASGGENAGGRKRGRKAKAETAGEESEGETPAPKKMKKEDVGDEADASGEEVQD